MSEFEPTLPPQAEPAPPVDAESTPAPEPSRPSRLRCFLLRHVPLAAAGVLVLTVLAAVGLYFWMSSAGFENLVRKRLVAELEQATGGRVEIASFHWRVLDFEAEAGGLVIHGLEDPGEEPWAKVERLRVRLSLLGFWSPSVLLRDLDVSHPSFHLIVYPDGSTNQPHSRRPRKPGKPALDTFFNLKASHVAMEQGALNYENRAASFDFQDRYAPLNFEANDVSLVMSYAAAGSASPMGSQESYRIEAGATDLNLSRGVNRNVPQPVHGYFQATLDLTRNAIYLRSLRLTARGRKSKDHSFEVTGMLEDFGHPRWQAKTTGELDLRLLDPVFGYPNAPEGIARLDMVGAGEAGEFRADGGIHIDNGSYIGTGVVARGFQFDAHVHADPKRLLVTQIAVRFRQGGAMKGMVDLSPWLPSMPGAAELKAASLAGARPGADRNIAPPPSPPTIIPMNGKVTAQLENLSLDTLLEMVCNPPFQHLGLDSRINGPATAVWSNGETRTVSVTAALGLSPSAQPVAGEAPTSGVVDGTYTQRDGAVALRKLELHMPGSQLEAHGELGAYPVSSPSALIVDFHSRNLEEFDTVLRSLGLKRNGKTGTAALPMVLAGQADFHGSWNGSLANPHLAGNMKATQLALEIPLAGKDKSGQSRFVHLDSIEAAGSYAAARIAIEHGLLQRGDTKITLSGSLDAAPAKAPVFDANSTLHLRAQAARVGVDDLQPFLSTALPMTGTLGAQLQANGPIHALAGSGWVQLDGGSVYGEPVTRVRAQGAIANQVVKLSSITVTEPAGSASATGSYDIKSKRFQVDAKGAGIDIARIGWVHSKGWDATGRLGFSVRGGGTFDDPELEGNATFANLTLSGEALGGLDLVAHTANHTLSYDVTTRLEGAEVLAHGQTAIDGDYETKARLEFSRFNIGALLKLAHIKLLSGESELAGTVTLEGPLARLEQLRGEARLQELEATVAGVHLKSEGGVHATMGGGRIHLDPLHVTGEGTDLRAQGNLALTGTQQMDFAASGSINLKLAETLAPDVTAGGTTTFQVEAHGPLKDPNWQGRIDVQNGSLAWEDIPNGLSQLHGTLEFNQNRLEVKSLTAMTGGGPLSLTGYLGFQRGLYVDLTATGKGVRIRYPEGVSSLADITARLQGTQNNLQLSGQVLITRFTVSPDLDIAALAAHSNAVQTIAPPDAPSNHVRLDVRIVSSPQLNFQNAFAKLAGDVDLRLRGTLATPSLLGRVSITEGTAIIAGTRYELQRGDVTFTNPVRIEPSIDLNATAHVEDYDITLGLHGTPEKMSATWRSDPPLPEADVVALLALGRTESQQRIYTQQQQQALSNPTTDALLGGALNATVSSRVQKLFGAGSVKVDPNYLGALGNSTSRIIVEEQLGRYLTLTYATNVNTTGQQLIQAEVAINRHVSLLVARDESGVFSMVVKATRRYR